jgi:hypothetical protein
MGGGYRRSVLDSEHLYAARRGDHVRVVVPGVHCPLLEPRRGRHPADGTPRADLPRTCRRGRTGGGATRGTGWRLVSVRGVLERDLPAFADHRVRPAQPHEGTVDQRQKNRPVGGVHHANVPGSDESTGVIRVQEARPDRPRLARLEHAGCGERGRTPGRPTPRVRCDEGRDVHPGCRCVALECTRVTRLGRTPPDVAERQPRRPTRCTPEKTRPARDRQRASRACRQRAAAPGERSSHVRGPSRVPESPQ